MTNERLVALNRQRDRKVDLRFLKRCLQSVLRDDLRLGQWDLGVILVGPAEMERINREFLSHEGSTDVITFPYSVPDEPLHGEIFVCPAEAATQARRFRTDWREELVRCCIHGILHLRGYDDLRTDERRKMKAVENKLVRKTRTRFPLHRLSSPARKSATGKT